MEPLLPFDDACKVFAFLNGGDIASTELDVNLVWAQSLCLLLLDRPLVCPPPHTPLVSYKAVAAARTEPPAALVEVFGPKLDVPVDRRYANKEHQALRNALVIMKHVLACDKSTYIGPGSAHTCFSQTLAREDEVRWWWTVFENDSEAGALLINVLVDLCYFLPMRQEHAANAVKCDMTFYDYMLEAWQEERMFQQTGTFVGTSLQAKSQLVVQRFPELSRALCDIVQLSNNVVHAATQAVASLQQQQESDAQRVQAGVCLLQQLEESVRKFASAAANAISRHRHRCLQQRAVDSESN